MSPIWRERAAMFEKPKAVVPIVKMCAKGLHNIYETGLRITTQTIKGRKYTRSVCRLCANEASRNSERKRRAA